MSFNFSDGFLFAVGWFVAKVAIHFAVGFISELLYRLWPWYKTFMTSRIGRNTRGGIQTTTTEKDGARLQGPFPFSQVNTVRR